LDVLRELEERAVVSVSWHATPCAVDEDGDEWWERERGRRPSMGGLLEHDDAADEGGPEGGAGSHAPLELTW
jgi:hypothetical protein